MVVNILIIMERVILIVPQKKSESNNDCSTKTLQIRQITALHYKYVEMYGVEVHDALHKRYHLYGKWEHIFGFCIVDHESNIAKSGDFLASDYEERNAIILSKEI